MVRIRLFSSAAHGRPRPPIQLVFGVITALLVASCSSSSATPASSSSGNAAGKVTISFESWRPEDKAQWTNVLIPAFEKAYPNIDLQMIVTDPTNYTSAVGSKLQAGTAGDVVMTVAYDQGLSWYESGFLADLTNLPGQENFSALAKGAFTTDDGKVIYSVPALSVFQGFFYNKDAFAELGLTPPTTEAEFFQVLQAIKANGKYTPLAFGDGDAFLLGPSTLDNFGPNYYAGETGRQGLIAGTAKFTDPQFVSVFNVIQKMVPYMPSDPSAVKYADTQSLFELGKALIFPGGSWEITGFENASKFNIGVFKPFVAKAGDPCYVTDHVDDGWGLNVNSKHPTEAKEFLQWTTTAEFAGLYSNALPGLFSLNTAQVTLTDPLASSFVSWRGSCKTTVRPTYQYLSRGVPNTTNQEQTVIEGIINGTMTPQQAAQTLQDGLASWYKPGNVPTVAPYSAPPATPAGS